MLLSDLDVIRRSEDLLFSQASTSVRRCTEPGLRLACWSSRLVKRQTLGGLFFARSTWLMLLMLTQSHKFNMGRCIQRQRFCCTAALSLIYAALSTPGDSRNLLDWECDLNIYKRPNRNSSRDLRLAKFTILQHRIDAPVTNAFSLQALRRSFTQTWTRKT